jgi:hypothetical protein
MPKKKKLQIDASDQLPGWPGFRNRSDRSGLDPVDSYKELAFLEGIFIRKLITLQLRTRNPFYLAMMLVASIASLAISLPFLVPLAAQGGDPKELVVLLLFSLVPTGIPLLAGVLLMINFMLSISSYRIRK